MPGTMRPDFSPPTDFTPRQGVELSAWERVWYDWIEPTRADLWLPILLALLFAWLAYRQRRRLSAAAASLGSAGRTSALRIAPLWREIAVIGLLAFIAWRLA